MLHSLDNVVYSCSSEHEKSYELSFLLQKERQSQKYDPVCFSDNSCLL